MARICAMPPRVNAYPHTRPGQCPCCGCGILRRRGEISKRVKDMYVDAVAAMRYRRGRAFTHYPQGVDRNGRGVRLRALMSLMWALGLSRRSVGCVLTALGCPASRMSGGRAVQEAGKAAARGMSERAMGDRAPMAARRMPKVKGWASGSRGCECRLTSCLRTG